MSPTAGTRPLAAEASRRPVREPRCAASDAAPDAASDAPPDAATFTVLVEHHRRALHGHCSRMLRSPERAEDAVQETLLRAWRSRATYTGGATFRTWLYRIATNACIDEIRRTEARVVLVPFDGPDGPSGDGGPRGRAVAPPDMQPDVVVESREAVAEAVLAAVELLPPRQRAVLVLRDVLRWPAHDVAALLDTSVVGVNSALQRARATLGEGHPRAPRASARTAALDPRDRAVLQRYVDALGRADAAAVAAVAQADAALAA